MANDRVAVRRMEEGPALEAAAVEKEKQEEKKEKKKSQACCLMEGFESARLTLEGVSGGVPDHLWLEGRTEGQSRKPHSPLGLR